MRRFYYWFFLRIIFLSFVLQFLIYTNSTFNNFKSYWGNIYFFLMFSIFRLFITYLVCHYSFLPVKILLLCSLLNFSFLLLFFSTADFPFLAKSNIYFNMLYFRKHYHHCFHSHYLYFYLWHYLLTWSCLNLFH